MTNQVPAFYPPDWDESDTHTRHGWRVISQYGFEVALLLLLAATFVVIRFQDALLSRTIEIRPGDTQVYSPRYHDDTGYGGNSTLVADRHTPLKWRCTLGPKIQFPYCGYELALDGRTPSRGLDLSKFDSMTVDLDYHGAFDRIRIYLKNFDTRYSKPGDPLTLKFNRIEAEVHPGHNIIEVRFAHFGIAEWWISTKKMPPALSAPQFDNITKVEFQTATLSPPGRYDFSISKIVLNGHIVGQSTWYHALLVGWAILIGVYLLHRIFRLGHDLKQRRQSQAAALRLARHAEESAHRDYLTRVLNRAGVADLYHRMAMDRQRQGGFAVILVDIDNFKQVNDHHGHSAGDQVLVAIAQILLGHMRAADIVGRWGGEEFLLICGVEKADDAVRVAAKLCQAIQAHELPQVGRVTASFGVYYASGQMEALERVTSRADTALYQAKEQGRNRVVLYQSTERAAA